MSLRRIAAIVLIGTALLLDSCGGGGGGGGGGTPAPSSNWDSMVWDQGNWG
jgi:hypothetical protein